MTEPDYLETKDGHRIAYHRLAGQASKGETALPGVVFLGGFRSDMTGTKAVFLEKWARGQGRAFLRFDYTGHGQSSGRFEDGCIGAWARDAKDAISALTEGPQIIVGSSMGGWIALLLARIMPERFAALVGIAAAPDFTEDSMWRSATVAQRAMLTRDGRIEVPSKYADDPYVITRKLIEDGRRHLVLRSPLVVPFPVRLLHGTEDVDVPWEMATRLVRHLDGSDVRAVLVRGADHRMSEPAELNLLAETLDALSPSQ